MEILEQITNVILGEMIESNDNFDFLYFENANGDIVKVGSYPFTVNEIKEYKFYVKSVKGEFE